MIIHATHPFISARFLYFLLVAATFFSCGLHIGASAQKSVSPKPSHKSAGGSQPAGCGLPCELKAKMTVSLFTAWSYPLQGQAAWADYQVTNTSSNALQGVVTVTIDGQLMTDANPHVINLSPGASYNGQAWIANAPAGDVSLRAQFLEPPQCSGPIVRNPTKPGKVSCTLGHLWADADGSGTVLADEDGDGLADSYESLLLQTYAPLMLFSRDHGKEEQYAPIDVIDFVRGSTLVSKESDVQSIGSNSTLRSTPGIILNPTNVPPGATADPIGTINPNQQNLTEGIYSGDKVPRSIYVSPSSKAQHGTDWGAVMSAKNVGLYGHVVMLNVAEVANNANQVFFTDAVAQQENQTLANELAGIYCNGGDASACTASIIRIEYWQFFGYSQDFSDPIPGTGWLAADVVDHGGDWCTVQLYVDPMMAISQPDKAILAVYHYAHGLRFGFDMQRPGIASGIVTSAGVSGGLKPIFQQFVIKQFQGPNASSSNEKIIFYPLANNETGASYPIAQNNIVQIAQDPTSNFFVHPVVYVEWGGHEFWPTPAWSYFGASKHGGDSKKYHYIAIAPVNVGEVGNPMPGVAQAPFVVGFAGFWGYYGWENQNKPPPGPPLHAEWLWYPGTDPGLPSVRPKVHELFW